MLQSCDDPPVTDMMGSLTVGMICDENIATVCAHASLGTALRTLLSCSTDVAVVIASAVRNPTAIGIVTWRDVLSLLTRGEDLESATVLNMLDPSPLVLHEKESVESALHQLRCRGTKHAPVIGAAGTLRGLITAERLLTCRMLRRLEAPTDAVRRGQY
jgi:Mg2+/Co2+ transporter CorB